MILVRHMAGAAAILIALLLTPLINGCGQSMNVDIRDLLSNPQSYQGRDICTEGIHVSGWEASALGASTYEVDGVSYLTKPVIWIEGADIRSRSDCFETQTTPPAEFCRVTVCGHFEYGGNYGHLGAHEYQLRGASY